MSKHAWEDVLPYPFIEEMVQADGVAGNEKEVSRVMKKWVEPAVDEVIYDTLGSIAFKKKGQTDLTVMLAGHIDEIGFLVKQIDEDGFIRLHPVGGWWGHVLPAHTMTLTTASGKKFVGLIGSKAPHGMSPDVRKKVMDVADLFLDIGVSSKQEVLDLGVQLGDMITPKSEIFTLANPAFMAAKAWDDRIGALIVGQVMRQLRDVSTPATIVGVGTVQEEVGLRGAKTSAYLVKPDIAITLDVTIATDTPKEDKRIKMGVGVTLEIADSSHFGHRGFINYLSELAKELKMEVQFEMLSAGGTDSGEIHKAFDGVVALTCSIPSRYIHSNYAIVHKKDVADTISLLVEFCKRFDQQVFNQIKNQ